jgi:hypothetical protein
MSSTVILPLSLTDFVKALREMLACTSELGSALDGGLQRYRSRKGHAAARLLRVIGFSPIGSRQILEKLASGNGSQADLDQLAKYLRKTYPVVRDAMAKLETMREPLGEFYGVHAQWDLDELIYGCRWGSSDPKKNTYGKMFLRQSMESLTKSSFEKNGYCIQSEAENLLEYIDGFNKKLLQMYEVLTSGSRDYPKRNEFS